MSRNDVDEAVASLGMIATRDAAKTLQQVMTGGSAELKTAAAHAALVAARNQLLGMAAQSKLLAGVRPDGLEDAPQLLLDIDRDKANALGVQIQLSHRGAGDDPQPPGLGERGVPDLVDVPGVEGLVFVTELKDLQEVLPHLLVKPESREAYVVGASRSRGDAPFGPSLALRARAPRSLELQVLLRVALRLLGQACCRRLPVDRIVSGDEHQKRPLAGRKPRGRIRQIEETRGREFRPPG